MILSLVAAASLASQSPAAATADPSILADASEAIQDGRLEEAKLLIGRAMSEGFSGATVERLMANLAFASGNYDEAVGLFQQLVRSPAKRPSDCEKGAISALKVGRITDAKPLADCAIGATSASWRAWNARGVVADVTRDWRMADECYSRAHQLAPQEARVINNQGWSKLLRGDWAAAVPLFERAATLDTKSNRIANNLELAKAALAADLPQRRVGESDREWAIRLNDAGVAAELLGETKRAVAAFTQALDASPAWYDRASNNLKTLSKD
jgi:Flp pilus assembly protein TadD